MYLQKIDEGRESIV